MAQKEDPITKRLTLHAYFDDIVKNLSQDRQDAIEAVKKALVECERKIIDIVKGKDAVYDIGRLLHTQDVLHVAFLTAKEAITLPHATPRV